MMDYNSVRNGGVLLVFTLILAIGAAGCPMSSVRPPDAATHDAPKGILDIVGPPPGDGVVPDAVRPDAATNWVACSLPRIPSVYEVTCGFGTCGNGILEARHQCEPECPQDFFCSWRARPSPTECCYDIGELCDKNDLGGASCESLGYHSGTLRCGPWCGWDASGCDDCASDPRIATCIRAPVNATHATGMALSYNGVDVGVAWVSDAGLQFARFIPSTGQIARAGCIRTASPIEHPAEVSLANSPSGWVIAVRVSEPTKQLSRFEVLHLSPEGTSPRTAFVLDRAAHMGPLIARAGTGPILIWLELDTSVVPVKSYVWVTGFDSRGAKSSQYPSPPILGIDYHGVETGDGTLVAAQSGEGILTFRIDRAGVPGNAVAHPRTGWELAQMPQLAWTGSEARLTWSEFTSEMQVHWVRLDHDGNEVGARKAFGGYFQSAPITTLGADSIIVLPVPGGGLAGHAARLDIVRVGATGELSASPFPITHDPNPVTAWASVRVGSDIVVGWIGTDYPGRLALARITP